MPVNPARWFRRRKPEQEQRYSLDDYLSWVNNAFGFNGMTYGYGYGMGSGLPGIQQTLGGQDVEVATQDFPSLAMSTFGSNAVVFACMSVRQHVFSAVRFQWQQLNNGRPAKFFGTPALSLLESPWPGGTTQDLLNRMIQDADLAGNSYWFVDTPLSRLGGDGGQELVRMRPDWVEIVLAAREFRGGQVGYRRSGYLYTEGGPNSGNHPVAFPVEDVAHFAPTPDPLATYRGMSWLTPVIREVQADMLMTTHKRKFFENGATPNMIVRYPPEATRDKILALKEVLDTEHQGVDNAYKRLHIGGGADVTVVGQNMQQTTFREVQGLGETRIAAAAGTPPVVVGLSEGLQGSSLNAGNYGQARRRFADGTMHPLWQNATGSLAPIVGPVPSGSGGAVRLWYDARDVPFLREDERDAAEIQQVKASTIVSLATGGFTRKSSIASVNAEDLTQLVEDPNWVSVQLQQSAGKPTPAAGGAGPKAPAPRAAERKFNPDQPRGPHGRWIAGLAGRIHLGKDEKHVSSHRISPSGGHDIDTLIAVVDTPHGRRVRLGIIPTHDAGKWTAANKGGTVNLTPESVRQLRDDLTAADAKAKKAAAKADADWAAGRTPDLSTPVAQGSVSSDWGDLRYVVHLTDDEPTSWTTSLEAGTGESGDSVFYPKDLAKLIHLLDQIKAGA
jgi:phage portal protein BeeE